MMCIFVKYEYSRLERKELFCSCAWVRLGFRCADLQRRTLGQITVGS